MRGGFEQRWYAPLLEPVHSTVSVALEQVSTLSNPWALPRTGLGGALAIQVSRGFGTRGWRRAGRAAVAALEGYNQRIHLGEPDASERADWLARDLRWARRLWKSLLETEQPTLTRVLDQLFGPDATGCDRPIPEAVLFLRCAVAAGVVIGEVGEAEHRALDRHATWLGLAWEADRGALDEAGWQGALGAVQLEHEWPSRPLGFAQKQALDCLDSLPCCDPVFLMRHSIERGLRESERHRDVAAWIPMRAPSPPETTQTPKLGGLLQTLSERWHSDIESSLASFAESRSMVVTRATDYVRKNGGKRIRPLIALASAQACGADPRRALPAAAAVEWLHQGALVIDDIVDAAPMRRGRTSLHAATSNTFATGIAVFVFARLARSTHGIHPQMRRHIANAAIALAEGERIELRYTSDWRLSMTQYYRVIEAKTARLFACAAAVGGLAAEASPKTVKALCRYGREVGLAFQIVDDLLDYVGDQSKLGKRPGTDLRAGKVTLPIMALRERLDDAGRKRLGKALGREDDFAWVRQELVNARIDETCRERAALHQSRALAELAEIPEGEGHQLLIEIAGELGQRRC